MAKKLKTSYCPCGQPSIGLRQGVECCAKCEEIEKGYWNQGNASNAALHGVSLSEVDMIERNGVGRVGRRPRKARKTKKKIAVEKSTPTESPFRTGGSGWFNRREKHD